MHVPQQLLQGFGSFTFSYRDIASSYTPVRMSSELEVSNSGIRIINDVYNANPASTKAAMELLKCIEGKGKRVAVLGDMLELGPTEIKFHEMVVEHCCASKFDVIALVGKMFLTAAENLSSVKKINIIHASNAKDLACDIVKMLNCDDVLVKGSRGMQMEKIVEATKSRHSAILAHYWRMSIYQRKVTVFVIVDGNC